MFKPILRRLILLVLIVGVVVCNLPAALAAGDSWVVYMYMCGSDLESKYGHASNNLDALKTVKLPENVKFVIQTGGAKKWRTKGIPNKNIARYVYDNTGFHEVDRLPDASMGDAQTLQDFLRYCKENYPAEHKMLLFWNHGGGSLFGFCFDEKFGNPLSLNDLRQVLKNVETANPENPAFDVVMFDTCLMATIETANTLYGFSRYLVASEEVVPANGTDYANWGGALAKNPAIDAKELGTIICDTYLEFCKKNQSDGMATLSVVDLSKFPALNDAYGNFAKEAVRASETNPRHFFTSLDRVANSVESYGLSSSDLGVELSMNMIDLGSFSKKLENLPAAEAFTKALEDAVVHKVVGQYRQHGMGLSGYYALDGNLDCLKVYSFLYSSNSDFSNLYRRMLVGSGDGKTWYNFDLKKLQDVPVVFDENNLATVKISPEDANSISSVSFTLSRVEDKNKLTELGSDDKVDVDWDAGIFHDDFDGKWPALNGNFLPIELDEQYDDYNLYFSYIMLNGQKYYLASAYDFKKEAFEILGAYRVMSNGIFDREIVWLKKGDTITPIFKNQKGREVKGETFTLQSEPVLRDETLPDGTYAFAFRFNAPHNESVMSKTVYFIVKDGEVLAELD